jgi:hypothetical protein
LLIGQKRNGGIKMKVRELIAQLQKLDQQLEVLCYTEDDALLAPKHGFRLLDIVEISVVEGEKLRGDDQIPSLKLGKGPHSQTHAIIEVTSDL